MDEMTSQTRPRKPPKHLTPEQKISIGARILAGQPKTQIARELGTTRQTVMNTVQRLSLADKNLEQDIRTRLAGLNSKAANAIERSMLDDQDVHKAAGTAVQHLKGMGVYAADQQVNLAIVQQVAALPDDWRERYVSTSDDVDATLVESASDPEVPDST